MIAPVTSMMACNFIELRDMDRRELRRGLDRADAVADEVIDGPRSIVLDQAGNRLTLRRR